MTIAGASCHELIKCRLNVHFGNRVDACCRFVKDENTWVDDGCAGDTEELPLTHGKINGTFANFRIVTLWQPADEFGSVGKCGGCLYLFASRIKFAVGDVFGNGAGQTRMDPGERGRTARAVPSAGRHEYQPHQ